MKLEIKPTTKIKLEQIQRGFIIPIVEFKCLKDWVIQKVANEESWFDTIKDKIKSPLSKNKPLELKVVSSKTNCVIYKFPK